MCSKLTKCAINLLGATKCPLLLHFQADKVQKSSSKCNSRLLLKQCAEFYSSIDESGHFSEMFNQRHDGACRARKIAYCDVCRALFCHKDTSLMIIRLTLWGKFTDAMREIYLTETFVICLSSNCT